MQTVRTSAAHLAERRLDVRYGRMGLADPGSVPIVRNAGLVRSIPFVHDELGRVRILDGYDFNRCIQDLPPNTTREETPPTKRYPIDPTDPPTRGAVDPNTPGFGATQPW